MNQEAFKNYLTESARIWVERQKEGHGKNSRRLSSEETRPLEGYFRPRTLARACLCFVDEIPNPPFYCDISRAGLPLSIDFRELSAIAFDHVILISDKYLPLRPLPSTLFHELVHVVQYDLLGVGEFAKRYVEGWFGSGFSYRDIPLERQAYELQAMFESPLYAAFSVEEAVEEWIRNLP